MRSRGTFLSPLQLAEQNRSPLRTNESTPRVVSFFLSFPLSLSLFFPSMTSLEVHVRDSRGSAAPPSLHPHDLLRQRRDRCTIFPFRFNETIPRIFVDSFFWNFSNFKIRIQILRSFFCFCLEGGLDIFYNFLSSFLNGF